MSRALEGLLVVSLEQAVAAPMASRRLADAGARVLKLERPEGDFARGYDRLVHGQSSYFVWLNRGKQSVACDLARPDDRALFERLVAEADVFIQNLKPGALARLGYGVATLAAANPRLIQCTISGYGESGPYADRKAYDMLIQAEAGIAAITGGPEAPARVGLSIVDIVTGLNAYEAILEALIKRGRTGRGSDIRVSMFDCMADWMSVPLLQAEGGSAPRRTGLTHHAIAPYGVFETADRVAILIAIQNDREWGTFARKVLGEAAIATDPRFATNVARTTHRAETDGLVARWLAAHPVDEAARALLAADIAFARVNDVAALLAHPLLRRVTVATPRGTARLAVLGAVADGEEAALGAVPALGADTEAVRAEFLAARRD